MFGIITGIIALCILTVPLYLIYKPPDILIRYLQRRWPDILWRIPTSKKIVALTIDDGPSEYTQEILDILNANNAAATFFIIGSHVAGRERVLEELIRNNHELGNHAMYDEPSRRLNDVEFIEQTLSVQKMIGDTYSAIVAAEGGDLNSVNQSYRYFRPGSGFFSTRMRKSLSRMGYRLVLGSIYPHDAQVPFWRVNVRHILSMVRPGGIIVCHDGRGWTIPMLKRLLPELKERGYRVVTVTELLKEESST